MRLGLTALSYLWQRDQHELLDEMSNSEMDAILVKVASAGMIHYTHFCSIIEQFALYISNIPDTGLNTQHLGQSLQSMRDHLQKVVCL